MYELPLKTRITMLKILYGMAWLIVLLGVSMAFAGVAGLREESINQVKSTIQLTFLGITVISLGCLCANIAKFLLVCLHENNVLPAPKLLNKRVRRQPSLYIAIIASAIAFLFF